MTEYTHPSMCWIRRALLMAILSHPIVQNANVLFPGTATQILIDQGRLFGGPELIDPGLTLAVFPYHTSFDVVKGIPHSLSTASVLYASEKHGKHHNTFASTDTKQRGYYAGIKLMVQLFYREPTYNGDLTINAEYVDTTKDPTSPYFGYYFQYSDLLPPGVSPLNKRIKPFTIINSLDVKILPGEEILTQWLDIIKYAIRDLKYLQPYASLRNPVLIATDYPTSTWSAQDPNLIFHTAYHVVHFDVVEPALPPQVHLPNIKEIDIKEVVEGA